MIMPDGSDVFRPLETMRAKALSMRGESLVARRQRLRKIRRWIVAHESELIAAAAADLGKPAIEFVAIELLNILEEIRTILRNLERWARPVHVPSSLTVVGTRSEIRYEPKGLCLIIAPWNFPFLLAVGPLVSALGAGNAVVVKPSEMTPAISDCVARMVSECFDPSEVYAVEGGVEVSKQLLSFPFDHIFFTGSAAVGSVVMSEAARNLTPVTLELGGKSPCVVTSSARIDEAALRIAVSKFTNAGQTCVAPDYVLVEAAVHDQLVDRLVFHTRERFSDEGTYTRIVSDAHFSRLKDMLDACGAEGASVAQAEPLKPDQRYFPPAILQDVEPGSRIMKEEIFGPILPVISVRSLAEAESIINHQPKPLGLYVFSNTRAEIERLLASTSSGGVCINDCAIQFFHPGLPFGGVGKSGFGRAHGHAGFMTFSNEKSVIRQRHGITSVSMLYPPHTTAKQRLLKKFMALFYR